MISNIMVGWYGDYSIASVGIANQIFFLMIIILFGVTSGTSIFIAQYLGKENYSGIKKVMGHCLIFGVIISGIFTIAGVFFSESIIGIFSKDPHVIILGGEYLRIISTSFILTSIAYSYSFNLSVAGKASIPMFISLFTLVSTLGLSVCFMHGVLYFPKLGVIGMAYAVVISRILELIILLTVIYTKKYLIAVNFKEIFNISPHFVKQFLKTTIPMIFNEAFWCLAMTSHSVVYARMGTQVIAGTNIALTVEKFIFVIFIGIANTCGIMVGTQIGKNDKERAMEYAKKSLIISIFTGLVFGTLVLLNANYILSLYAVSPYAYKIAASILMLSPIALILKGSNSTMYVGVLRSGGDAKFTMLLDMIFLLIQVPMCSLSGLYFKIDVIWVYLLTLTIEVTALVIVIKRFYSRKWINNLTDNESLMNSNVEIDNTCDDKLPA